jgi:hypothetical protein
MTCLLLLGEAPVELYISIIVFSSISHGLKLCFAVGAGIQAPQER